jgi:hypothetical protein
MAPAALDERLRRDVFDSRRMNAFGMDESLRDG